MCLLVLMWLIVLGYNTGYLAVCTTLGLGKLYRRQHFKPGLPDYLCHLTHKDAISCFHITPDQPSALKHKVNTVPLVIRFTVKLRIGLTLSRSFSSAVETKLMTLPSLVLPGKAALLLPSCTVEVCAVNVGMFISRIMKSILFLCAILLYVFNGILYVKC